MKFTFYYEKKSPQQIKHFVKEEGISKGLLAAIKFQGGKISVNGKEENVLYELKQGDCLTLMLPIEKAKDHIVDDPAPIDILFEDEHLLVINKPPYVPSIPVKMYPDKTMVNRVSHYYHQQGYQNDVVHTVTRLDRDTSGVMLFAKHRLSHAKLDKQLRNKTINKQYFAYVPYVKALKEHGLINQNIARAPHSSMERMVVDTGGKVALTEYWIQEVWQNYCKVKVQLHTGRTHQIRVHFASLNAPLLGDDLYGTSSPLIQRQALHCASLTLKHPFTKEQLTFEAQEPEDMKKLKNML